MGIYGLNYIIPVDSLNISHKISLNPELTRLGLTIIVLRWHLSLGMERNFIPPFTGACDYLSLLELKSIHFNEIGPRV